VEAVELVDDLIQDGYTQVWIHWADIPTDDEHVCMTERLILDMDGIIIARKINPPLYSGWSRNIGTPLRPAIFPIPDAVMDIDLDDRDGAIITIEFFENI